MTSAFRFHDAFGLVRGWVSVVLSGKGLQVFFLFAFNSAFISISVSDANTSDVQGNIVSSQLHWT